MKTYYVVLSILLVLFLVPGFGGAELQAQVSGTWFTDNPISIFGDPEMSRVYVGNGGINLPTNWTGSQQVLADVNLTIANPQSIEFFVNGSPAEYVYSSGDGKWRIVHGWQPGGAYTLTVRVTYSSHHSSYTCGTWTGHWDTFMGMED